MNDVTEAKNLSLVPRSIEEAMRFAKLLSQSELVPKDFKDKDANIFVAVQWGMELGLQPLQALQSIAVINGRPSLYGDAGKALLLSRGYQIEQDDFEQIRKDGFARCTITRPDGQVCRRTFSVEDAKQARLWGKQGPWTEYPQRQMSWRAFWFAARDIAADVLRGVSGAEEAQDMPERDVGGSSIAVEQPRSRSEAAAPAAPAAASGSFVEQPTTAKEKEEKAAAPAAAASEAAPAGKAPAGAKMNASQLNILRAKLKNAAMNETDLVAKFGSIEDLRAEQFNTVQDWILERGEKLTRG